MQDFPDKATLLGAVAEFLDKTVRPALDASDAPNSRGLAFRVRVAAHMVATVAREVTFEGLHDAAELSRLRALLDRTDDPLPPNDMARRATLTELNAELARRLREDPLTEDDQDAIRTHLVRTLEEKLSVVQPRFDVKMRIEQPPEPPPEAPATERPR
ncbi:MAG: hypothetical protein KC583_20440 [Myxococcales bacterium]|nr:hypothetical protein [Myxococcales bacterium]